MHCFRLSAGKPGGKTAASAGRALSVPVARNAAESVVGSVGNDSNAAVMSNRPTCEYRSIVSVMVECRASCCASFG